MMQIVVLLVALLLPIVAAAEQQTQTFQVRSQPAAALVETVEPLLDEGGSVSAWFDKLIVKGTPAERQAVQSLLAEIDRPPRRLIIEVRRSGASNTATSGVGYGVRGDGVQLGRVPPGRSGQIRFQQAETRFSTHNSQRVRALDGRPALIRAAQRVPVYQGYHDVYGNRVVQGFRMQYRDVGSGFIALPRVHGDQVTVEVFEQGVRPAVGARFDSQAASTVLTGRLGEWMVLALTGGSDSDDANALGMNYRTQRTQDDRIELRVLPVN
jgi:type II secretory pathway component GspD/PulD (secretin)